MKRNSRARIPPLNSLRAFEATARLGSFVLAAAELHVSPSAVSQQIRKLEDFLAKQLFIRRNNQLMLTEIGAQIQATTTDMMDRLASLTSSLTEQSAPPSLVVSALQSLGIRWLSRRLPEFIKLHPDIRIDFRIEDDPVDFLRNRIDVRVSFGEHLYPDLVTVPLWRDEVTLMCTPEVMRARKLRSETLDALQDSDLIHVLWRTGIGFSSYPTWVAWLAGAGVARQVRRDLGHTVDTSCTAVDMARGGCGIALVQRLLAEEELKQGTLVAPFKTSLALQYSYCAVFTHSYVRNPALKLFVDWLASLLPDVSRSNSRR